MAEPWMRGRLRGPCYGRSIPGPGGTSLARWWSLTLKDAVISDWAPVAGPPAAGPSTGPRPFRQARLTGVVKGAPPQTPDLAVSLVDVEVWDWTLHPDLEGAKGRRGTLEGTIYARTLSKTSVRGWLAGAEEPADRVNRWGCLAVLLGLLVFSWLWFSCGPVTASAWASVVLLSELTLRARRRGRFPPSTAMLAAHHVAGLLLVVAGAGAALELTQPTALASCEPSQLPRVLVALAAVAGGSLLLVSWPVRWLWVAWTGVMLLWCGRTGTDCAAAWLSRGAQALRPVARQAGGKPSAEGKGSAPDGLPRGATAGAGQVEDEVPSAFGPPREVFDDERDRGGEQRSSGSSEGEPEGGSGGVRRGGEAGGTRSGEGNGGVTEPREHPGIEGGPPEPGSGEAVDNPDGPGRDAPNTSGGGRAANGSAEGLADPRPGSTTRDGGTKRLGDEPGAEDDGRGGARDRGGPAQRRSDEGRNDDPTRPRSASGAGQPGSARAEGGGEVGAETGEGPRPLGGRAGSKTGDPRSSDGDGPRRGGSSEGPGGAVEGGSGAAQPRGPIRQGPRSVSVAEALKDPHGFFDGSHLITLDGDLLFEFDRDRLSARAEVPLRQVAKLLRLDPATRVLIEGHADTIGTDAHNQTLSERRAEAVRTWLVEVAHVNPSQLDSVGYGSARPLVPPSKDRAQQAPNRRVELRSLAE